MATYQSIDPAAHAYRVLALYWLASGDARRADDAVRRAAELVATSADVADYGLPVELVRARVEAALGETAKADSRMAQCLRQTRQLGLKHLELSARLEMAEIALQAGRQEDGTARLEQLEGEASRLGYGANAQKARRAMPDVNCSLVRGR